LNNHILPNGVLFNPVVPTVGLHENQPWQRTMIIREKDTKQQLSFQRKPCFTGNSEEMEINASVN